MTPLDRVLELLKAYKYAAMFAVLVLCGLGLPIPEEATLLASGLAVGWKEADFWAASAACVAGIVAGDTVIFFLGRFFGRRFLASRILRWILTPRRLVRVQRLFSKHGNKAVFFGRFFMGVRIGVFAYAGQHGMKWSRFLFLDFFGALISGPTSIWVGKFAAEKVADPQQAREFGERIIRQGEHWLYAAIGLVVVVFLVRRLRRKSLERPSRAAMPVPIEPAPLAAKQSPAK